MRSVATLDLTRDENLRRLLDTPHEYVVKPRRGEGGDGVVVCARRRGRPAPLPAGGASGARRS